MTSEKERKLRDHLRKRHAIFYEQYQQCNNKNKWDPYTEIAVLTELDKIIKILDDGP